MSDPNTKHPEPAITRRQLLGSGALVLGGLTFAGTLAEVLTRGASPSTRGALGAHAAPSARGAQAPVAADWRSRPDLRIPGLTVLHQEPGASREAIFMAPYNAPKAQAGAVIVDADGQPVWEHPLEEGIVTTNFRVQLYRGSPVLTWWEGRIELGHGVGEYVIADSSYRTIRRVQAVGGMRGDLHEFVITRYDTALLTSYVVTNADLSSVGGPRRGTIQDAIFQEIDLATGKLLLEWHSLGTIPLSDSYARVTANWDFFHINSLDLDGDGILVSSRSTHTVYKIARTDGRIIWRLGGKQSDFSMGPGASFAWQHDARRQPDGTLTVFDNGATPAVEQRSRGLILDVDERLMQAELLHQYTHAGILAGSQGSVQLLDNGSVFVGWGEVPRLSEFDPDGRLLFDALLGEKYESYRAFRHPWSGRPASAPALVVAGRGRARTAYSSWNGATGITHWRLLAGARASELRAVSVVPSQGFETAIPAAAAGPLVAVEPLSSDGAALGRSAVVRAA
jgi:Arylsulfotransferase (ASST)